MNLIKFTLIAFIFCLPASRMEAQGWRQIFGGPPGSPFIEESNGVTGLYTYPDGSHIFVANYRQDYASYYTGYSMPNNDFGFGNTNFDENGTIHHFARDVIGPSDSIWLVLESTMPLAGGNRSIYLTKYRYYYQSPYKEQRWHKPLLTDSMHDLSAISIQQLASGDLITLGNIRTSVTPEVWNPVLIKTDMEANPIWSLTLTDANNAGAVQMVVAPDGGFYVLKNVKTPAKSEAWLLKTNALGQVSWQNNLSGALSDTPGSLAIGADGSLFVSGVSNDGTGLFLIKTNEAGAMLWRRNFALPYQEMDICQVLVHDNGELAMVGTGDETIFVVRTTATGSPIWERNYGRLNESQQKAYEANITSDGGYLIGGKVLFQVTCSYLIKTDENGIVKPGLIYGNVFKDLDTDCLPDAGEIPLENWIVSAVRDDSTIFYGNTDPAGNYRIECDTGNYVVKISLPSPYWQTCINNVPHYIGYLDTAHIDFPIRTILECPYMTVEHFTSFIRPCDTLPFYVTYCNQGTAQAEDTYVEIQLDSILSFISSEIQPSSVNNNLITFPLGDLASLECQQFSFQVAVACGIDTGLVACSQAHIFPDSLCVPPWTGAVIAADGVCDGDSIRFTIRNVGNAASQVLEYIVIEDAVLLHQGIFQLQPDSTMEIVESAAGATLHLLTQQEPGVSPNNQPIVAVEGCTGSSGNLPSTGFFNQFSQNDAAPFLSDLCIRVVYSYDPNDKQAFPTGFGVAHNIFAHNDLEYMIRFQNTGTDTAFRVMLLDTLSAFLDPASVQLGVSSHPCRLDLEGTGVLRFTFHDIELPHEAVNEAGSNGFVTFRVKQKPGNLPGTQIENRAGIYFDFNPPVITNTVYHTIHAPLIEVLNLIQVQPVPPNPQQENSGQGKPKVEIKAYPNPFSDQIRFELTGMSAEKAHLKVFNTLGARVRDLTFTGNSVILSGEGLSSGIYLFQIRDDKGVLAHGKIQVMK